ncbi:hypothetical protein FDB44_14115 [Clostridium botulinum]|nr:hypothetical protein [Clostridium botulinum]NFL82082.1 hypothetical protein [Clostridium botulinum]NFN12671.1 hypothetical protein [Clostridium botulinum]NFO38227.1 hypothetical protein [Clostridium botulinum]NFO44238.1 hypothetical protein [Clostridium botulinum]
MPMEKDWDKDQEKAIFIIKKYLKVFNNTKWTSEYILANYSFAVEQLIKNSKKIEKTKESVGVISQSQGDRSTTFMDNIEAWVITEDIKALLPNPINFKVW